MIRKFLCNECGIECKLEISTDGVPSTPRACSYPGECAKKSVWKEVQQSVVVYDGGKFTIPGWKYPIVVNLKHLAIEGEVPLYCGSTIVGKYHAKIENGKLCLLGKFEPLVADGLFTMCADSKQTILLRKPFSINGQKFVPTDEEPIYCVGYATLLNVRVVCRVNVNKVEEEKPLPVWCKVGKWVWDARCKAEKQYQRVQEIKQLENGNTLIYLEHDQLSGKEFFENVRQARVRPWTFEEAPLMLKVRRVDEKTYMDVIQLDCDHDIEQNYKYWSTARGEYFTSEWASKVMEQLDGSPCGVLEHLNDKGEWVE